MGLSACGLIERMCLLGIEEPNHVSCDSDAENNHVLEEKLCTEDVLPC